MVSSTPRLHFTPGKDPLPILQEAGWVPESVWTGGKSRPHRDSIPDRPARSSVTIPPELPGPLHYIHYVCIHEELLKVGLLLLMYSVLWGVTLIRLASGYPRCVKCQKSEGLHYIAEDA